MVREQESRGHWMLESSYVTGSQDCLGAVPLMRAWEAGVTHDAGCCALMMGSLRFSQFLSLVVDKQRRRTCEVQTKWWNGVATGGPGKLLVCHLA